MNDLLRVVFGFFPPVMLNEVHFTRCDHFGQILYDDPEWLEYWVESLLNHT